MKLRSTGFFALYYARHDRRKDETVLNALERTLKDARGVAIQILRHLDKVGWDLETSALETHSGTRIRRPKSSTGSRL